jgi:hypothetical protein
MIKIINTFRTYILYHTTYFNAAKQYVNSLTNIEKVNLFTYGMDVSEAVQNTTLRRILKSGGNVSES